MPLPLGTLPGYDREDCGTLQCLRVQLSEWCVSTNVMVGFHSRELSGGGEEAEGVDGCNGSLGVGYYQYRSRAAGLDEGSSEAFGYRNVCACMRECVCVCVYSIHAGV